MIVNFQEIKSKKVLNGICKICKKKRTRTISEEQTVNPFNKNEDGTIKNYYEVNTSVKEELNKRIEKFQEEGFVCKNCKKFLGY